jgi:MFS family permease
LENSHLLTRYGIQQVLHWMSTGILIPVMVLLQTAKGMSLSQVGIIIAIYSTIIILFEIPTGSLADTYGRKNTYLLSLVLVFISMIILLFADSFVTILTAFSFYGVSRALNSGSLDAWFVDEHYRQYPEGNLQQSLAVIEVSVLAGLGISSILGGILPDTLGVITSRLFSGSIYTANIMVSGAAVLVCFIYTALFVHEKKPELHTDSHGFGRSIGSALKESISNPQILLMLLTVIALGFGLSSLETFWQPRVKEIVPDQTGTWIFGALSAGYFLSAAAGSLAVIPIARRMEGSYHLLLSASRMLFAAGLIVLALQKNLGGFALFYVLLFFFNGASSSPHQSLLNSMVNSNIRSTMLSVSSFSLQAGGVIGALLGGIISQRFSIPVFWFVSAAVLLVSSLAYLMLPRYRSSES